VAAGVFATSLAGFADDGSRPRLCDNSGFRPVVRAPMAVEPNGRAAPASVIGRADQARSASISGPVPIILITRFRL
jgi:hypothetical protein